MFKLINEISRVLVDRLTSNLKRMNVPLSHEPRISKSDVFFYFCLPPKGREAQGKSIFELQNAAICLIFEISLFQWFML